MKTKLLCILLLLSGILRAQTIENPHFKARAGNINTITKIERTPEITKLYIHAVFRPNWWIKTEKNQYLEDAVTGQKYVITGSEGIELGKETYIPESGEMDYILLFPPLPKETKEIHWLEPGSTESNTYNISLNARNSRKNKNPLELVKGNWLTDDALNEWSFGIYDSLLIMDNRIYAYENIRKKGKKIELTLKDRCNGKTETLWLTLQKNGNCLIQKNKEKIQSFTKEEKRIQSIRPESDFGQFFRPDTAYLQGYIKGYDTRLGFTTGLMYLSNGVTREDYPTIVNIHPDGSFDSKFIINHPIKNTMVLSDNRIPFYIEPGQTATIYIDWEAVLTQSRARDYNYPINNIFYMGPSAELSRLLRNNSSMFTYPYKQLTNAQKTLSPNQFKEQVKPVFAQWDQKLDSLTQIYRHSAKAVHLLKNELNLEKGKTLFEFLMSRDYYASQDTTNQALKIKEDDTYYDFLKTMPINDVTLLVSDKSEVFINRFEYMPPLSNSLLLEKFLKNMKKGVSADLDGFNFSMYQSFEYQKDSIIHRILDMDLPLLWQIAKIRSLTYKLNKIHSDNLAHKYLESIIKEISDPFLLSEAERIFKITHPEKDEETYQLPEGKATDIFRRIIQAHRGKTLYVDFWGTYCGPCRYNIEHSADLREKYKNHPDFEFIFITSEGESPEKDYNQYVEKNLKGEASYRISQTEFNYLRELFHFNGIPHYELVEKDGSISQKIPEGNNLASYLEKRFGGK